MASSSWQKLMFMALIVAIAVPISTSRRRRSTKPSDNTEKNLRDLCSETDESDVCWNILKPNLHRFDDSDERDIAENIIDLAVERSRVIGNQLSQWFRDSNDDKMKRKYGSCSDSYNDVERNLEEAHQNLDSDDSRSISDLVDDAEEELDKCTEEFEDAIDTGHVVDRNDEIGLYLDLVRAASARLEDY